jgi:transcriptional regulator with XRE-family HTH domain
MKKAEFPKCETLRLKRIASGLSQSQLTCSMAEKGIGNFSSNYISRFECGSQKPWKKARVALAQYFECSENELFPEHYRWVR